MSTICDDLRAAILQAAMQGKLTKQLPEDGNARDLLERINGVKKQLNKRAKELDEITDDEIPFSIPENWQWARLGQIFNITAGGTPSRTIPEYWGGDLPWVKIGDMNGKYVNATSECITEMGLKNSSAKLFPSGTLLYSVFASIGTVSILNIDATTNQAIAGLSKYTNDLNTDYMYYALVSLKDILLSQARGAAQLNINQKILSDAIVPIPPLDEQKRIANKIEELMARVADLEQSADALASLKKAFPDDIKASLLQAAMQGKLTKQLPGDGDMNETFSSHSFDEISIKYGLKMDSMDFEIPNTWAMAAMDELFNFVDYRGKTPHKAKDGKIFLITSSNIKNGFMDYTRKEYISEAEYAERQTRGITHRGDLLFTTEAPMGNAAICDLEVCSCGQRIITFQEKEKNTVMPELFMYFILSPSFQKQLEDNCTGTTAKGIKGAKLKHFLIPVPPLAEQRRIVERLERLIQNINVVGDLTASE